MISQKKEGYNFDKHLFDSYTNPNAKYPVYGALVFFYKSENGGSVFFDEFGPPWQNIHVPVVLKTVIIMDFLNKIKYGKTGY